MQIVERVARSYLSPTTIAMQAHTRQQQNQNNKTKRQQQGNADDTCKHTLRYTTAQSRQIHDNDKTTQIQDITKQTRARNAISN